MQGLLYKKKRQHIPVSFLEQLYENQKGKCALTGLDLTIIVGNGRIPTNLSLDRIDNTKGYEENNIQLVCLQANLMKQQLTHKELVVWCSLILNVAGKK